MVDTWAVHFPSAQTLFTSLQSFYINHGDYHLFKVKWLSTCPKIRSVHIEWKPPASMVYSIIPNSYLARSLGNAFSYAEPITTCRVNKYYTNSVIIDEKLIDGLNLAASSLFFSSYDSLPQGLSLDPSLGSITGYPTCASETKTIEVKMDVKKGSSSYSFRTTVVISVVGSESSQNRLISSHSATERDFVLLQQHGDHGAVCAHPDGNRAYSEIADRLLPLLHHALAPVIPSI